MRVRARVGSGRILAAAAIVLGVTVGAPATAAGDGGLRPLTVMTQNLYLGSDLGPALDATTAEELVAAVAQIYGTAVFTNFPVRAEAVADDIAAERPDLIGLQEVSNWVVAAPPGATAPSFDFLEILLAALERRGLDYDVAAVSDNADIGPIPLVAPARGCGLPPACSVRLQDRDVILVNADTPTLSWSNGTDGRFEAQQEVALPVGPPLSFDRGWASIEARYRGSRFRFVNTHLEVAQFAAVQEAQTRELLAGPLRTSRPVVLVGDLNSAADGSTTASYRLVVKSLFIDAWWTRLHQRGFTCCQNATLTNPMSELKSRIDFVFTRWAIPTGARLVGDRPFQAQPPLWSSDHAGVVADILVL